MNEKIKEIVDFLQSEVKKANMNGVIVGISGGIDSALVSAIAKIAFPENSLGVIMPIGKMGVDYDDAKKHVDNIKINNVEVDLTKPFETMKEVVKTTGKLSVANIKPRLRMTALYSLAQENGYLVLGTDNAAEMLIGYFTKFGDGAADLFPVTHLTKREVRELAKELGVIEEIINKKPTAALWENQTDEDELGFGYDYIDDYIEGKEVPTEIKQKIEALNKASDHKRKFGPKVRD